MAQSKSPAPRLADYFVVLHLEESQIRHGSSVGVVKQRFPENDWPDVPFSHSLEMFCMPQGWNISSEKAEDTFYVCTLTDLMGAHQYACCLQIYEPCSANTQDECDDSIVTSQTLYKPKVFVILTRFSHFELFRACLNRIQQSLKDGQQNVESMVATLLSGVHLSGRVPISFNLGSERLSVRPLPQKVVPQTGCKVAGLVRNLGSLHNLLTVFRAVLTDQKIILHSRSLTRISDASYAIKSIIFPLEYTYTFVSVLPELLLEYLESPMPYLMGVLSSVTDKLPPVEAVLVDLDLGEVRLPPSIFLAPIPAPFLQRLTTRLQMVLDHQLTSADLAEPPSLPPTPDPAVLDKNIRACFLMFFAEVLSGYRNCLELVRLHSQPLIVFHKSAFCGMRRLSSPLLHQLIDSQKFQVFVASRGLPYRECDVFDDLACTAFDLNESLNPAIDFELVVSLGKNLLENEKQERMLGTPKTKHRASLSISNGNGRISKEQLDNDKVESLIRSNLQEDLSIDSCQSMKVVPSSNQRFSIGIGVNSRRLQVLTACLDAIFDNRLSEARKMTCAVELSLRSVESRVSLCCQLGQVPVTKATLHPPQFELVVRLLNCALEQESDEDEHGIAYACLRLCNLYCRRLPQGAHQFAYTCVQDHTVWSNHRFWEAAFFHDIHESMRRHYGEVPESEGYLHGTSAFDMWNLLDEPTGMAVAAEQLQAKKDIADEDLERMSAEEESIVYGQAKHYVNLMVYLRVPLDPSRLRRIDKGELELRGNGIGHRDRDESMTDSDCESGYIENVNDGDLGTVVVTWISRLVDRLCSAAGLPPRLIERLTQDIPGFVAVHIDNLEEVYKESRQLAPPPKTKLLTPVLLTPCERIVMGGLRCVLLADTQEKGSELLELTPSLVPAEGAVFITNYRVVFKGRPLNPFMSEDIVVRSMPIMSLTKEKSISDALMHTGGQLDGIPTKISNGLHDALQLRTSCFQLIKLAFDEEVTSDSVELFSKTLSSLRWPSSLPHSLFAFSTVSHLLTSTLPQGHKARFSTIKDFKKTISNLPIKGSLSRRPQSESRTLMSLQVHRSSLTPHKGDTLNSDYLDLSDISDGMTLTAFDPKRHAGDYERLRFKGDNSLFRITYANTYYGVCKSYPSCFVVPSSVSDDTFAKICKGFKHGRLPVVTWIGENGALMIRGSGLTSSNVLNKIKKQGATMLHPTESAHSAGGSRLTLASKDSSESGPIHSSEYQVSYLNRLAQASPSSGISENSNLADSLTSIMSLDSLLTADGSSMHAVTPDLQRRSMISDNSRPASNFIRSSGGKAGVRLPSVGSRLTTSTPMDRIQMQRNVQNALSSISRKNLYILVEKSHSKLLRADKNCEFVPVSFPSTQQMKVSFKKLLRAMKPSWPHIENTPFLKALDESDWMLLVSNLLLLCNSITGIITTYNSSVAICIEEGWDATAQLTSISQLLLDPYYRTFAGFRTLIEKEWLAFGHRFSHRANHTISSQSSGIAPVFLMFLDVVHQIREQFPHAFEFNDFYLRFLAFHSQSAFFRTFLLDSESERVQLERMAPDNSEGHRSCVWNYIQLRSAQSPVFHNLLYNKDSPSILFPSGSPAAMDVWSFYTEDMFSHGSPYDIDIAEAEICERDEEKLSVGESVVRGVSNGRVVEGMTRCLDLRNDDGMTFLMQTAERMNPLEKPKVGKWLKVWEESRSRLDENANTLPDLGYDRHVMRVLQKKSALRILLRGVTSQVSSSKMNVSTTHLFERYSASGTLPHVCSLCQFALHGTVVKTGQRCKNCGVIAHDKCIVNLTLPCGAREQEKSVNRDRSTERPRVVTKAHITNNLNETTGTDVGTLALGRNSRHNALHQGYLSKKGATFKLWTPRWFVLEANSHKLYYYESESDTTYRGSIDICDVGGVEVEMTGSKAILELRTSKRTFCLLADSRSEADLWKEKIETVLRE